MAHLARGRGTKQSQARANLRTYSDNFVWHSSCFMPLTQQEEE